MEKVKCTNCGFEEKSNAKYCSNCGYELPNYKNDMQAQTIQTSKNESKEKRKKFRAMVWAVAFGLSFVAVQQIFFAPPSIEKILMTTASEMNKNCPMMADQFTRLDNVIALPNNSFQYNYTLLNESKSEINLDTAKKYIKPVIINRIKTDPGLELFREKKITMIYNYRDKYSVFVVKYTVTPEMYKE